MPSQPKSTKDKQTKKHFQSTYKTKKVPVRLAKHKHTGKLLPYYCTSYALIFFVLAFLCAVTFFISLVASADQQSSSINLKGTVKVKPPEIAAKITYPADKTHFKESQLELKGSCLQDTYVEIYRKNIFSGMNPCSEDGRFRITITLVPGENVLTALIRDSLGQYGPKSSSITVFLDSVSRDEDNTDNDNPNSSLNKPLLIYTDPVQHGLALGQTFELEYEINGDTPPYSIAIDWGDGSPTTLDKYDKEGKYSSSHKFIKSGQNTVRISGIGSNGSKATIQTIVVVHSLQTPVTSTENKKCDQNDSNFYEYCTGATFGTTNIPDIVWPAVLVSGLMTASFWAGEKIIIRRSRLV